MSRRSVLFVMLAAGCAHQPTVNDDPPVAPTGPVVIASQDDEVRAVAERFVAAAERHDFQTAYSMLAGPLRDRYTPERLAQDFDGEPLAKERLARIRAALKQPFALSGSKAVLSLGAANALTLAHEADGWRVAALE